MKKCKKKKSAIRRLVSDRYVLSLLEIILVCILFLNGTAVPVYARPNSNAENNTDISFELPAGMIGNGTTGTGNAGGNEEITDTTSVRLSGDDDPESAGPTVAEIDTSTENPCITWFVRGIEGAIEDTEVYVGAQKAEVESAGRLQAGAGPAPKTLILLDNSESIGTAANQAKIKAIMTRMIWNHQNNERFAIKTFAKDSVTVMDYTKNYDKLRLAIEKITFHDQQTYLRNVLYDEIRELINDEELDYSRIVIISDGTDDSRLGKTYDELARLVDHENGCCPIYTVGCFYEDSVAILDQLFALSRITGSPYFSLDDFETAEEAADIADEIRADGDDVTFFRFSLPLELRDGSLKSVGLHVTTASNEYNVSKSMFLPGGTVEEMRELYEQRAAAQKEAEEKARKEAEKAAKAAKAAKEKETEPEPEEKKSLFDRIFDNVMFQNLFGPALLLLALLIVYLRGERKPKEFREVNQKSFSSPDEENVQQTTDGQSEGKVALINVDNPEEIYYVENGESTVIGRSSGRCDIAYPNDRMLASRHAMITMNKGKAILDNLGHPDATFVQNNRVNSPLELLDGDVIRLGSTRLKVRYE